MSGWDSKFIAHLTARHQAPRFRLESFGPAGTQAGRNPDTGLKLSSYVLQGYEPIIDRVAVSGSRLTLRSWGTSNGALDIALAGDLSGVRDRIRQGLWVRLVVVWPDSEGVVFVGACESISRGGNGAYQLRCLDILAALRSRPTRTAGEYALFHDLPVATALTAGYTAGAGTLTVTSTTGFEMDSSNGGFLLVTPGAGDPFYLRWTSKTSTVFTLAASLSGELGTLAVNASIGAGVAAAAGAPRRVHQAIVRCLLTSTGDGTNGAFDAWPASWGCALPDWLFDDSDCRRWDDLAIGNTTYRSTFVYTDPQESPKSVIDNFLSASGFFAAMRQGAITIRPVLDAISDFPAPYAYSIDDGDIESIPSYEQWSDQSSPVYYRLTVSSVTSESDPTPVSTSATQGTRQLPAQDTYTIDLTGVSGGIHSQQSDNRTRILARLARYFHYPCEAIRLRAPDRRFATLTLGDVIDLTTDHLTGWHPGDRLGIRKRPALVVAVSTDWQGDGGSSSVDLIIPRLAQVVGA